MKYLLDSHTWLWLARGVELHASTIDLCSTAASNRSLYLSPLSVWEIARKAQGGNLHVNGSLSAWIDDMLRVTDVILAEFNFAVAVDTAQLPASFHKDPIDRGLAATCRVHDYTLLTRDRTLLKLASSSSFEALAV